MSLFNWKKTKADEIISKTMTNKQLELYGVFYFETEPEINDVLIELHLQKNFENIDCVRDLPSKDTRQYFLPDYQKEDNDDWLFRLQYWSVQKSIRQNSERL